VSPNSLAAIESPITIPKTAVFFILNLLDIFAWFLRYRYKANVEKRMYILSELDILRTEKLKR
jgi:hypothetical protein